MAKVESNIPLGQSEKINVAVQRPTVNVKEAENVGEQAAAANRANLPQVQFLKHGTLMAKPHPLESAFD